MQQPATIVFASPACNHLETEPQGLSIELAGRSCVSLTLGRLYAAKNGVVNPPLHRKLTHYRLSFAPVKQFKNVTFEGIILQSVMLPVVVGFPFFFSLVLSLSLLLLRARFLPRRAPPGVPSMFDSSEVKVLYPT
ncbi:MAG: hypothetical protein ACRD22_12015 [Terriglobia bacterium]